MIRAGRKMTLDLDERHSELEGVNWPVTNQGLLVRVIVLHVEVGE